MKLSIRTVQGVGGASGKQYEVAVSSLSSDLQARLEDHLKPSRGLTPAPFVAQDGDRDRRRNGWINLFIAPAVMHKYGSRERGLAIRELAAKSTIDWDGKPYKPAMRTISRWVDNFVSYGLAGNLQAQRSDTGKKRVIVTKAYDQLVPLDDEIKKSIVDKVRFYIRALLAQQVETRANRGLIQHLASQLLKDQTVGYGYIPNDPATLDQACAIPLEMVKAEYHFSKIGQYRRNRKAFADNKVRIRRELPNFPMDRLVVDVHKINVRVIEDRKIKTPFLMAFLDVATGRVWGEVVWFKEGGSVRNIDMISVLARIFAHPEWGVPKTIQFDNGSENYFADYLGDILNLGAHHWSNGQDNRVKVAVRVVRAQPYNAAAKEIEGWFGRFSQRFMSLVSGYIGDDRMNAKQVNLGKLAAPVNGTDKFFDIFSDLLASANATPQGGRYLKLSPNGLLQRHINNGWTATVMDEQDLAHAFSDKVKKRLRAGAFQYENTFWRSVELARCHHDWVIAHIPKYRLCEQIWVETLSGQPIGYATPDHKFAHDDPRGAIRSASLNRERVKSIRDMEKTLPKVDMLEDVRKIGRNAPPIQNVREPEKITFERPRANLRLVKDVEPEMTEEEADAYFLSQGIDPAILGIKS